MMERARIYRWVGGLGLITLALLLLLSVASHNAHDPPKPDHPPNAEVLNWCGIVGAYVSYGVKLAVGTGGYLLCIGIGAVGVLLLVRKTVEDAVVRGIGCAILLIAWCAFFHFMLPKGGPFGGYGGLVGLLVDKLLGPLGAGKYLIVLVGFVLGALLAADVWVFWVGRKSVELATIQWEKRAAAKRETPDKAQQEDPLAEQKKQLRKRLEERQAAAKKEPPLEPPTPKPSAVAKAEAPTLIIQDRTRRQSRRALKKDRQPTSIHYDLPGVDLLDPIPSEDRRPSDNHIEAKRAVLERTLEEFGIAAQVVEIDRGPVITQFELELAPGVKIGRIVGLSDDIARALKAPSVRIVAPIPGKSTVGVEVPNARRETVHIRELFESGVLGRRRMTLPILVGKDASGEPLMSDLAQMPHLLVAGATGSGKSVCINSIIMTILMTQYPDEVKLLLVDPKMVELAAFHHIPHLMSPVLTDMKKAASVLEWAVGKMDQRYSLLANVGARNIAAFNALGEEGIRKRLDLRPDDDLEDIPTHMPYIIIIIDELADLMMVGAKEIENAITRLAQKSRAVGIHLIVATQRPSTDVITGLIKANLPSRIAFHTSSKVDSRVILDRNGADKLLGQGDMLFLPPGTSKLVRAQGTYTSDEEIQRVTAFVHDRAKPHFETELVQARAIEEGAPTDADDLFDEAVRIVLENRRGSVSLLQRKLGIGYSRAARLIDLMAETGIVGDYKGSQAREVLYTLEEWEAGEPG